MVMLETWLDNTKKQQAH